MFNTEKEIEIKKKYTEILLNHFKDRYNTVVTDDGFIHIPFNKEINGFLVLHFHVTCLYKETAVSLYMNTAGANYSRDPIKVVDETFLEELEQILNRLKIQSEKYVEFRNYLKEYLYIDLNKVDYSYLCKENSMYIKNDITKCMIFITPSFDLNRDLDFCNFCIYNTYNSGFRYNTLVSINELYNDYIEFFLD